MSEILAYGYKRHPDDLSALGATRMPYVDHPTSKRRDRALMLHDIRPGDVVRVLYLSDLGGAQWKLWRDRIESAGAAVEECRPVKKPRKPGRPRRWGTTPEQDEQLREVWLRVGPGLDERLEDCSIIIGRKLTRADRHVLYGRYGAPEKPKNTKEPSGGD